MGKLLSVIIPVHNKADTLPHIVDCLRTQDLPMQDFEVIFVADNCTDGSLIILRSAAAEGIGYLLEIAEGSGSAAGARNRGLGISTGKYTLFLDPDIIIPRHFLSSVVNHLKSSARTVCMAPVYGNAGSLSTWPFIVQDHTAWLSMNGEQIARWAASQEGLRDLRNDFAASDSGYFDHLAAPWVFCWSSVLALEKGLIEYVGGFDAKFKHKGSEDIELGYRLHKVRARFKLMLDVPVFHIPHHRDRTSEERLDRLHEREMLRLHPSREMEALCAFDGAHANPMLEILSCINSQSLNDMSSSWNVHIDLPKLKLPPTFDLIVGFAPQWLTGKQWPGIITNLCAELAPGGLPLHGLALPFEDLSISRAVLVGTWQLYPERLACRIMDEVVRVAREVYLLKNTCSPVLTSPLTNANVQVYDAPYWERTHLLRRSFYDFELEPLGECAPIFSYRLKRASGGQEK